MTSIRNTLMALGMTAVALGAWAQKADEHKDHHPAGANPPAATAPARPASAVGMTGMDPHMKAMQAMHEKMMAAKTPEARQALMAEHMKLMQDGMAMMESMMQMMMDRMPAAAGK